MNRIDFLALGLFYILPRYMFACNDASGKSRKPTFFRFLNTNQGITTKKKH